MAETRRYTKQEILRNRIVFAAGVALVVGLIILAAALIFADRSPYPKDYAEMGPVPAVEGQRYLTGRDVYDFGSAVPQCAPARSETLDGCLFVGGSHFEGMNIDHGTVIYSRAASVFNGSNAEFIDKKSGETAPLSSFIENPAYHTVYLHFGLNELNHQSRDAFYDYYAGIVKRIKSIRGDMTIYLCTVLPVAADLSERDANFNNENVAELNAQIARLAAEQKVFYIDLAAPYTDENGALSAEAAEGKMYIKAAYYPRMTAYILSHIAPDYAL